MQIVYLCGSPRRNGNSDTLAQAFLQRCSEHNAVIKSFHLNDLNYRGCQACDGCKTTAAQCVITDDLSNVLAAVEQADMLVLASPVYYGDVSAQLKGFIDRTYSYLKPGYIAEKHPNRFKNRKQLVFILAQGHRDDKMFADILPRYSDIFYWTGFAKVHSLRAIDVYHRGDMEKKQQSLFVTAHELADELCQTENR